ncbi:aluminum-activated malate transporter 12-like protein [Cinnamomum micranthum f. kanehirae]|uniref:Aluminum-activated malate transporter 12-like protein n=1 Tax=Cinnamomum micranthum f. kanehirae TaxID=337451 RepID=A0A3S4P9C3_9MAGN|nr:aluminum-activated malate transporter 12-like protein [Cinnamomum micranthum f. kanehirae]
MDSIYSIMFLILTGTTATYLRFIPYIKNNYDYGVVIFLLTFNLIMVSSYHVRLLVFLIWSGEDLHNSTVSKLEGLAKSIEACANEYFQDAEIEFTRLKLASKDTVHKYYRAVLDSKSNDENYNSNDNDTEMIRHYLRAGSQDILGTVTGIPGNNM